MLKKGQNWGKIANYTPQCSTKIGTPGTSTSLFCVTVLQTASDQAVYVPVPSILSVLG